MTRVQADEKLDDLLERLGADEKGVLVEDDGKALGVLTATEVVRALAGSGQSAPALEKG